MLRNTFCHIPGIGLETEKALWRAGVLSWDDVLEGGLEGLSPRRTDILREHVEASVHALDKDDADYFYHRLPVHQQWRLFGAFRQSVGYLDIETTGLGGPRDSITTICIYDGNYLYSYVQGMNRRPRRAGGSCTKGAPEGREQDATGNLEDFADQADTFKLLVTYNGKRFDLPFIRAYLGVEMVQAHIDLMFVLRSLGYRGGLKGCERQLGISRDELEGVDGYFAVLLWNDYVNSGNEAALETLLAYNATDVVNLETLMVLAYNMKLGQTPFAETHALAAPEEVRVPFEADGATIRRIRRALGWT